MSVGVHQGFSHNDMLQTHNRDRAWDCSNGFRGLRGRLNSRCANDLDKTVAADGNWVLLRTAAQQKCGRGGPSFEPRFILI